MKTDLTIKEDIVIMDGNVDLMNRLGVKLI